MSWNAYIDSLIGYSKDAGGDAHVDRACLVGKNGSAYTDSSNASNLAMQTQEIQTIAACFESKNFGAMQANGVVVGGHKYRFLRESEDGQVYAKDKGSGAITMQATASAIVVAHCPEGKQAGKMNTAVASIAEYLQSLNM